MGKPKITLKELVSPYAYQPPEVLDSAVVAVKTTKGLVQVLDSYRDILTINGVECECLVLVPSKELKLKGWLK